MVKWLLSLNQNINIRASNDFAFKYSCQYGNIEIAKFLSQIMDIYQLDYCNNEILNWQIIETKNKDTDTDTDNDNNNNNNNNSIQHENVNWEILEKSNQELLYSPTIKLSNDKNPEFNLNFL
jgi:hypothetical protein